MRLTLYERFIRKVRVNRRTGCWEWTASINVKTGYGQFMTRVDGKSVLRTAHSMSYELHVGPIPDGHEIDHVCRNRKCCNPSPRHLQAVPHRVNWERGSSPSARYYLKAKCRNGHQYVDSNIYWTKNGRRVCRKCREEATKGFREQNPDYKKEYWTRDLESNRQKQREYLKRKKQTLTSH